MGLCLRRAGGTGCRLKPCFWLRFSQTTPYKPNQACMGRSRRQPAGKFFNDFEEWVSCLRTSAKEGKPEILPGYFYRNIFPLCGFILIAQRLEASLARQCSIHGEK